MDGNQQPGRLSSSRRFVESSIGPVCRAISRLSDLLDEEPQRPLVLLNRVSTRRQERAGHLDDDRRSCLEHLSGCNVIKLFGEVGSGKLGPHRTVLKKAIKCAKRHGAVVVVSSRDRLIRAQDFDGTNQSDDPTEEEYLALTKMARGVKLASILAPWKRGRSAQIKRGQKARGNRGGRPPKKTPGYKKRWRKKKQPLVIASMSQGRSIRQTAALHDVKPPTVHLWWTNHKKSQKTVHPKSTS